MIEDEYRTSRGRERSRKQEHIKAGRSKYVLIAVVLVAVWFALPYWTLYRLQTALQNKDVNTLDRLIDWPAIRSQVREMLMAQMMQNMNKPASNSAERAGAGLGMALGAAMIGPLIDSTVTAHGLVSSIGTHDGRRLDIIRWAAPSSPTSLDVVIGPKNEPADKHISLVLEFRDWGWKMTRIAIPAAMLQ